MKPFTFAVIPLLGLLVTSVAGAPVSNPSSIEMEKRAIPGGILTLPDVVEERAIPGGILTLPDVVEERAIPGGILTLPDVVEKL